MTGGFDPFCRGYYPWGKEDIELLEFYKILGNKRAKCKAFAGGDYVPWDLPEGIFGFERKSGKVRALVVINLSDTEFSVDIPKEYNSLSPALGKAHDKCRLSLLSGEFSFITK